MTCFAIVDEAGSATFFLLWRSYSDIDDAMSVIFRLEPVSIAVLVVYAVDGNIGAV
ncbi:hypothetical protein Brsp01_50510 [Brucella sp. NBRC 12950]|nr:hypothetical protein Brsp01_50510 [Brucella sp. NBRC 12950]